MSPTYSTKTINTRMLSYVKTIVIISSLSLLFSCAPNHRWGLKFLGERYEFEKADGTFLTTYGMPDDRHADENKTCLTIEKFNPADINKEYENIESLVVQELSAENLQKDFTNFDYSLVSIFHNCGGSYYYEMYQFRDLYDTLQQIYPDVKIAKVLISEVYDYKRMHSFFKEDKYLTQPYVMSWEAHGEIIQVKTLDFIKKLCPDCYDKNKYHAQLHTIYLCNNKGEVLLEIESEYWEEHKVSRMKNYDQVVKDLFEIVKTE